MAQYPSTRHDSPILQKSTLDTVIPRTIDTRGAHANKQNRGAHGYTAARRPVLARSSRHERVGESCACETAERTSRASHSTHPPATHPHPHGTAGRIRRTDGAISICSEVSRRPPRPLDAARPWTEPPRSRYSARPSRHLSRGAGNGLPWDRGPRARAAGCSRRGRSGTCRAPL